jgi:hypothetical protein
MSNIEHRDAAVPSEDSAPEAKKTIATGIGVLAAEWTDFSITLIKSGLIGIYLTSLLFVIGWAYADRYFELFGISLSGLQRDVEGAFYIYALWALRDGWMFLAVSGAALVIIAMLLRIYAYANQVWRPTAIFVIAAFVMVSFVAAFWLGQWRASTQVPGLISEDYQSFPRVTVTARGGSETAAFLSARAAGEQTDCLRKLYMDQRNLYLYPGYESFKEGIPPVYVVPLSEIAAIEISKARGLCKP